MAGPTSRTDKFQSSTYFSAETPPDENNPFAFATTATANQMPQQPHESFANNAPFDVGKQFFDQLSVSKVDSSSQFSLGSNNPPPPSQESHNPLWSLTAQVSHLPPPMQGAFMSQQSREPQSQGPSLSQASQGSQLSHPPPASHPIQEDPPWEQRTADPLLGASRQTSDPPPLTTSLFPSAGHSDDFFSIGQPQSLSPVTLGMPSSVPLQQSVSAPATTIHKNLSSDSLIHHHSLSSIGAQEITMAKELLPLDRPPSNADIADPMPSMSSTDSFPTFDRLPSNADITPTVLSGKRASYPLTNADFPLSTHPQSNSFDLDAGATATDGSSLITNEPNNLPTNNVISGPKTNDQLTNDVVLQREQQIETAHPLSEQINIVASGDALNQSTSSLLDNSQEDITSVSPVRLLPPAPSLTSGAALPYTNTAQPTNDKPPMFEISQPQMEGDLRDWEIIEDVAKPNEDSTGALETKFTDQASLTGYIAQAGGEIITTQPMLISQPVSTEPSDFALSRPQVETTATEFLPHNLQQPPLHGVPANIGPPNITAAAQVAISHGIPPNTGLLQGIPQSTGSSQDIPPSTGSLQGIPPNTGSLQDILPNVVPGVTSQGPCTADLQMTQLPPHHQPVAMAPHQFPPTGPPASFPPTGPPASVPPTGPPVGVPPTGPPVGVPPTGPPAGVPPTGPPASIPPTGPPGSVPPTIPPASVPSTGLPASILPTGPPASIPLTGLLASVPPTGPPAGVPPTGPPASIPPTGPPGSVPPTIPPACVPSTGLPASILPTGPPASVPPTGPPASVPPTGLLASVPPTGPPASVPPTGPPTGVPPTIPPASIPPTVPPASIPPTVPPARIPPTVPPASIPPTIPPASIPPTVPPASVPPTVPPASIPPTVPPASIPPTIPSTGIPPTGFLAGIPGVPPTQQLPSASAATRLQPNLSHKLPSNVSNTPLLPTAHSQLQLQPPIPQLAAGTQTQGSQSEPNVAMVTNAGPVNTVPSSVPSVHSVPSVTLPPQASQQAQPPPDSQQAPTSYQAQEPQPPSTTYQEPSVPPSHKSHLSPPSHPQRRNDSHPHDPHRDPYHDPYGYSEDSYNYRYGNYDDYHRGGHYQEGPYHRHPEYYPPKHDRYYRPGRNPYPDHHDDRYHHSDQYHQPYDPYYRDDRYYRPHPQDLYYDHFRSDPYYGRDYEHHYYDNRYQSDYAESEYSQAGYHDDQYDGYDESYSQTQDPTNQHSFNPIENTPNEFDPAETSAIPGQVDYYESGQTFYNSPPGRHPPPANQTYERYVPEFTGYNEGQQQWETVQPTPVPIETTPPPPPRQTPEIFAHPHVRATFAFGGQLVTVLPSYKRQSMCVDISLVKDLVKDPDSVHLQESVNSFPGPFLASTPKNTVVQYVSKEIKRARERVSSIAQSSGDCLELKQLEDEVLLWDFLLLLCRQNGVILPTDISDLLMKDSSLSINSTLHLGSVDREEALSSLRDLLLAGQRKEALELACSKCLWGHALMLADEQSRNYVVNRFTASLSTMDPLGTFYTLLLGRVPSAVKVDGLQRAGDWRAHLAMILANRLTKLDTTAIISLGDSLLNRERLCAAHLCYFLGDVYFGCYGDQSAKYTLLGVDQSVAHATIYPNPENLRKMEVFEYAMSLSKQDFSLPGFQMYKFLLVLKLLEAGYATQALKYCEQIGTSVVKGAKQYTPVFLNTLVEVSVKLHHLTSPYSVVEIELPSWLATLNSCVQELTSSDYTPHLFSPSPAFSSVSQTYTQPLPGGMIVSQSQFLTLPTSSGGTKESNEVQTSEVGVFNVQSTMGEQQLEQPQVQDEMQPVVGGNNLLGEGGQTVPDSWGVGVVSYGAEVTVGQSGDPMIAYSQSSQETAPPRMNFDPNTVQPVFHQSNSIQQPPPENPPMTFDPNVYSVSNTVPQINYGIQQTNMEPTNFESTGVKQMNFESTGVQQMNFEPTGVQQMNFEPTGVQQMNFEPTNFESTGVQQMNFELTTTTTTTQEVNFELTAAQQQINSETTGGQQRNFAPTGGQQTDSPPTTTQPMSYMTFNPSGSTQTQLNEGSGLTLNQQRELVESHENQVMKEEPKKEEKGSKAKDSKKETSKSSGGWGFGLMKYILPQRKNQAHLPDDRDKSIYWDDKLKKWIDTSAEEEDEAPPPPPPSDSQLKSKASTSLTPSQLETVDGVSAPSVGGPPSKQTNQYSRSSKRGRLGARSKYVDVLNPGGSTKSETPALPGPMAAPLMPGGQFTGNFFIPQQPPQEDNTNSETTAQPSARQTPQPVPQQQHLPNSNYGNQQTEHQEIVQPSSELSPNNQFQLHQQNNANQQQAHDHEQQTQPMGMQQLHSDTSPQPPMGIQQQQYYQEQHQHTQQPVSVPSVEPVQQESSGPAPQTHPQFFNPSAFAPVSGFPMGPPGSKPHTEQQEDTMSTVSLMSETSQEVSNYMGRSTTTSSSGYNRMRQGIRGPRGYPTVKQAPPSSNQQPRQAPPNSRQAPPTMGGQRTWQ